MVSNQGGFMVKAAIRPVMNHLKGIGAKVKCMALLIGSGQIIIDLA